MNTVALPATGESGIFVLATVGSAAASYWIGPSTSRSGRRAPHERGAGADLVDVGPGAAVARRVLRHRDARLDAETGWRSPRRRSRCRPAARSSGRDDRAVAVDEDAVGQCHEEDARDDRGLRPRLDDLEGRTDRVRRRVLRAGDHGRPRVRAAPMSVPKYETSVTVSRASSTDMPLCARSRAYSSAKRSRSSGSERAEQLRLLEVEAELRRPGADGCRLAEDRDPADLSRQQGRGRSRGGCGRRRPRAGRCACRTRVPGRAARARTERCDDPGRRDLEPVASSSASTCCSNRASARSALRGESAARRPRVWVISERVS